MFAEALPEGAAAALIEAAEKCCSKYWQLPAQLEPQPASTAWSSCFLCCWCPVMQLHRQLQPCDWRSCSVSQLINQSACATAPAAASPYGCRRLNLSDIKIWANRMYRFVIGFVSAAVHHACRALVDAGYQLVCSTAAVWHNSSSKQAQHNVHVRAMSVHVNSQEPPSMLT